MVFLKICCFFVIVVIVASVTVAVVDLSDKLFNKFDNLKPKLYQFCY